MAALQPNILTRHNPSIVPCAGVHKNDKTLWKKHGVLHFSLHPSEKRYDGGDVLKFYFSSIQPARLGLESEALIQLERLSGDV